MLITLSMYTCCVLSTLSPFVACLFSCLGVVYPSFLFYKRIVCHTSHLFMLFVDTASVIECTAGVFSTCVTFLVTLHHTNIQLELTAGVIASGYCFVAEASASAWCV